MKSFTEEVEEFYPLSVDEKSRMRDVIRWHMRANPLPQSGFEKYFKRGNTGFTLFNLVYLNYRFIPVGVAFVGVMLIASLGTFAASEGTLPGEKLYSLKRGGENVRSAFTFYPAAEAIWQAERTERRLAELEALSKEGNAPAETKAQLANEIGKSLGMINQSIAAYNKAHFKVFSTGGQSVSRKTAAEEGQSAILLYAEVSAALAKNRSSFDPSILADVETEEKLAGRMISIGNRLLEKNMEAEAQSAYLQAEVILSNLKGSIGK